MMNWLQASEDATSKPSFFAVVISILAALFGVQSERNRQRDFNHGNPAIYIAVGIVFIVLFVLTLVLVVNWVVPSS